MGRQPLIRGALAALLVLGAGVVLLIGVVLALDRPYLRYTNVPFPVLTPQVRPGETVLLRVGRCNDDDQPRIYIVGRTLVPIGHDAPRYVLRPEATQIDPGCLDVTSTLTTIPERGVRPGRYYIAGTGESSGHTRSFVVQWMSQPFEVLP